MKHLFSLLLLSIFIAPSCSDDDDDETKLPGDVKKVEFLDVRSYTKWVYFSFSKGEVVEVTDYANDLSWDIAFHRGDVRLNGGASGKGLAEVVNTNKTDWNSVKEAPASGYVKDEVGKITTSFTGSGITEEDQPFSQTLGSWITIDTSNPPPKYTYHNYIYVVKAADGKYVKLWIYDYKNEKESAGYVSFNYQYNESGATTF
jgi:hypothetical protein